MNPVYEAAVELQRFVRRRKWRFCVIGGLAVVRWGEVRATQDVDIGLASFAYEEQFIERATSFRFDVGVNLVTASAEDLIILKLLAERPIDLFDVRGILVRQQTLDWDYVYSQLEGLAELKPDSDMARLLREMHAQLQK